MRNTLILLISTLMIVALSSCELFGFGEPDVLVNSSVAARLTANTSTSAESVTTRDSVAIDANRSLAVLDAVKIEYHSPYLWTSEDGLPKDDVLDNSVQVVEIESFMVAADIMLHSSSAAWAATVMDWGGDPVAEPTVDLMSGDLTSNVSGAEANVENRVYETIRFQLNTHGEALKPVGLPGLSLPEVLPFSLDTSNIVIYMSSLIEIPFIGYLEAPEYSFNPNDFDTLVAADVTDQVQGFHQWVGNAPVTREFYDYAYTLHTDDPGPGVEPTVFLPMDNPIDLSDMEDGDQLELTIEGYFDGLLSQYYFENSNAYWNRDTFYFLSPFVTYVSSSGSQLVGPLPFTVRYSF